MSAVVDSRLAPKSLLISWPQFKTVREHFYGRQLQQPADEQSTGRLDVASMTRQERDALKRRILSQHPHLVEQFKG